MAVIFVLALSLVPLALLAWNYRDVPQFGYFQDDGLYLIGAKCLAEGGEYRILSLPGQPYQTKYPPLYPLFLSLAWMIEPHFPDTLQVAMWLNCLWLPAYVCLCWLQFQQFQVSYRSRILLCALVAVNPVVAFLSVNLMAEMMFSTLILASLVLLHQTEQPQSQWLPALLAGALAGAAWLTKSMAASLIVCGPLWLIVRRQRRGAALFLLAAAPPILLWLAWSLPRKPIGTDPAIVYYTDYVGWWLREVTLGDIPQLIKTNANALLNGLGSLIALTPREGWLFTSVAKLLAVLALAGVVRLGRWSGYTPMHLFAVLSLPIFLLWNFSPHERFTLPLLPLLLAGLWFELTHLFTLARAAWRGGGLAEKAAGLTVLMSIGACSTYILYAAQDAYRHFLPGLLQSRRAQREVIFEAFRWLQSNSKPNEALVAYDDTQVYLYMHRPAARLRLAGAPFFRGDRSQIVSQFQEVSGFSTRHRLPLVLWTASDFHTDLSPPERIQVRELLQADSRLTLQADAEGWAIFRLVEKLQLEGVR